MKKRLIKIVAKGICLAIAGTLYTGISTVNIKDVSAATSYTENNESYIPPYGFTQYNQGVTYGSINKVSYYSSVTGTMRKCNIYLPPNYNANKKYPVLYLLHGIGGTEDEWVYGGCPNQIISNQIAAGNAKDMIVVMPNVRAAAIDSVPSDVLGYANIAAFDNFINDLRSCLMPYII